MERSEALGKTGSEIAKEGTGKKALLVRLSGSCKDTAEY